MHESSKVALLLEGNRVFRDQAAEALHGSGLATLAPVPGDDWPGQVAANRPDYLVIDWDLPGVRDSGTIDALKRRPGLPDSEVIVLSAETSPDARALAYAQGADDWLAKSRIVEDLHRALSLLRRFELTFWGIRGTLPVPGAGTLKYGGNTSCLSVVIGHDRKFAFDAGTGMKALSDELARTDGSRFDGVILITHPHWDHLNSLPFFAPLYITGNRIRLFGPAQGRRSLRDLISDQMDGTFFPITVEEFRANVSYQDLLEGNYRIDGVSIRAKRLRHPGYCLAYRVTHRGRSFAYVTDNELGTALLDGDPFGADLIDFLHGTDVLIHDTTYFDEEYPGKINWGHSSVGQVTRLAHQAGVKHYYLFHHDPDHGDTEVERKLEVSSALLAEWGSSTRCHIAAERMRIRIDSL